MYVSEMKPPRIVRKKVVPTKFVRVVDDPAESKCITPRKYNTKLTIFPTKPMFSNPVMTENRT